MLRRGFIIAWLILVVPAGAVRLSSSAASEAGEQVGRFIKYDNGTALDTETQLMWMTRDFHNLEGRAPRDWREAVDWPGKMNQQH